MKSEDKKQNAVENRKISKTDKSQGKKQQPKAEETSVRKTQQPRGKAAAIAAGVAAIAIILAVIFLIAMPGNGSTQARFSEFKSNFNAAPKVSIIVYYYNASTYGQETVCSTYLVEVLAAHKAPGSINYYTIDNNTCTYIPNGIGHAANVITNSSSFCLAQARLKPSISMSYGASNGTLITANHLNITGNMAYYKACPIAVDIS